MKYKSIDKFRKLILVGYVILIAACGVILTLAAEKAEAQFHLRWDLTESQVYSIGGATKEVLANVEKGITIYTLYRSGSEDRTVTEMLRRYRQENAHIKVVNIDPVEKPFFTQQFQTEDAVIQESSLIVQEDNSENYRVINAQDLYEWKLKEEQLYATGMVAEQRVTSAIASIQGGEQTKAYFVTGHAEMNLTKEYYLAQTLKSDGYDVREYNLIYNDTALSPNDCLLFLAPRTDISDEEYRIVQGFMDEGGKAVFLINPAAGDTPNFNKLFASYGLKLQDDLIVEADSEYYLNSQIMIRPSLNEKSPVLRSVVNSKAGLILPRCRGIVNEDKEGIKTEPIVYSSRKSYGKIDPYTETLDKEKDDVDGPFLLGVTTTSTKNNSKMVLLGNSDFVATLENAKYEGNIALFMDSVAWASEKADSVVIQPKSLVSAPLKIKSTASSYRLMVLVILVIPGMVLGYGALVWRRRLSR